MNELKKKMSVPIARTYLNDQEINSVLEPLRSGWLVQGKMVSDFEEKWSKFTEAKHSIAVTSCTAGLSLMLSALNIKPGDQVIVPAFTWISTANVVEHVGADVIFCDISLDTFNIDTDQIEALITPKTKAIIVVHLFGLPADMAKIGKIAETYNLSVIEDAACGFGARYHGKHVGTFGKGGVFSFHPRKAITTGEGGMITTDDSNLAGRLRRLRDHGAEMTDLQRHLGNKPFLLADHPDAGFNQRMTDIQGALGSSQMDRAYQIVEERKSQADIYQQFLSKAEFLRLPLFFEGLENGFQSFPCLFSPVEPKLENVSEIQKKRNEYMDILQTNGVSTRPATHAVHMLSFYKNKYKIDPETYPNAYIANNCSISLPLFNGMTSSEQKFVIDNVFKAFQLCVE